jgi:uncharacterized membrane protein
MIGKILLLLFYVGFPVIVIKMTLRFKTVEKIGAVIICYIIGLIIGNIGIIPSEYADFQDFIMQFSVALAIPLLLFSTNLKLWYKLIGSTFLSLVLGLISVVIIVIAGYFIFRHKIDDIWQITGMLVGLYSGGDPNLASLKTALHVDQTRFIIVHASDLAFGAFFLLFILVAGKKTFELFLPKFSMPEQQKLDEAEAELSEFHNFKDYFRRKNIRSVAIAIVLSMLIIGIASFVGGLSEKYEPVITILIITTLALLSSFIPKVRNLDKSFQTGVYFILVFSLVVASRADFREIFKLSSVYIFMYVIFSVIGSIIIHTLLSKIFKIDADTMIITSIALVYSVPFIPVVAESLKNKYIIVSGIIIGLFGYTIGNYLGVVIAYALK